MLTLQFGLTLELVEIPLESGGSIKDAKDITQKSWLRTYIQFWISNILEALIQFTMTILDYKLYH